jgi:DMSO reductase anchor subunit
MHPAPSVILFTVLSGLGFGLLGFLALGAPLPAGWPAFLMWGLGFALAVGGLLASTFHLGNPQRALLAFTQWRTSWLSREAWAACAALVLLAPVALSDWLGLGLPWALRVPGAAAAALTVLSTSMIYAQIAAVPRWRHWTTPALFAAFALAGGAILSGQRVLAALMCLALAGLLVVAFRGGDGRFAARGASLGSATGLDRIGVPGLFELPHTADNYLLREMIFVVGRKHALRLRRIAVVLAGLVPALLLLVLPAHPAALLAVVAVHLAGAFAARWLFFAEAEHVVGLYYGRR